MPSSSDIVSVKERHEAELMGLSGVVGIGVGDCNQKPCIKVFVEKRNIEVERPIPKHLEGFEVDVEVTGPAQILPTSSP